MSSRREFSRKLRAAIRPMRSKSRCLKWIEAIVAGPATDECLPWPFAKRTSGYGQIFWRGTRTTAHRVACTLAHGEPPDAMHAAHACGTRDCCNPRHLEWKSARDNASDKLRHGTQPRGSRIYNAKLTETTVSEIRTRLATGDTLAVLAAEYGVSMQTVSDIKRRAVWRHVQ